MALTGQPPNCRIITVENCGQRLEEASKCGVEDYFEQTANFYWLNRRLVDRADACGDRLIETDKPLKGKIYMWRRNVRYRGCIYLP